MTEVDDTTAFVAVFGGEVASIDDLAAAVAAFVAAAEAAWPGGWLDRAAFVRGVAAGLAADVDPVAALAALRADDLYLARACAAGHVDAIRAFEERFMPAVTAALRGMRVPDDTRAEVAQRIRERLLVGDAERGPRIADYAGRGSLERWVRTAAAHTYFNLKKRADREVGVDDDQVLDAIAAPDVAPELAHLKERYRAQLRDAFTRALSGLSDRHKALLRYRFVDGLAVDRIAAIYKIHRGTMHRWLADARDAVATATEGAMAGVGVAPAELASLQRLVRSQIDLSLSRLLDAD